MEVEIIFSGLCGFNNVRDTNDTMGEPSVILVRTDDQGAQPAPKPRGRKPDEPILEGPVTSTPRNPFYSAAVAEVVTTRWDRPPGSKRARAVRDAIVAEASSSSSSASRGADDVHIPHLSFNSNHVRVNEEAEALFRQVPFAPGFRYLPLNGVEIEIANNPYDKDNLVIDPSYDLIVKKDDYWPPARNKWNRAYVPERGDQPSSTAVVGFMRFGTGTIRAGNLAPVEWEFDRNGQGPLRGRFAEEAIYSGFPHDGNSVVIRLLDVDTREFIQELRFTTLMPNSEKLTLFLGNNDSDDIDNAVQRRVAISSRPNFHFKFMNRVAHPDFVKGGNGPIPAVFDLPGALPIDEVPEAGVSSGPCGPTSTNG